LVTSYSQIVERDVEAINELKTGNSFVYQTTSIPVLDIGYHEFSDDSVTWRKEHQAGDCYIRFANTTSNTTNPYTGNSGYHDDWWVLNFCTLNGALDTLGGSGLDTLFVHYYQSDTVFYIDTIVLTGGSIDFKIPSPATITGSTTNYSDTAYHTHNIELSVGDLINTDTTGVLNGQVLKWNSVQQKWKPYNDLLGGGSELRVREVDGNPDVNDVVDIIVENGTLTDNGGGSINMSFLVEPVSGEQDFYRTDTINVSAGDIQIVFDSPLPNSNYVVNAYAIYGDTARQNLICDNLTQVGFTALNVLDNAVVSYLAILPVDSLTLAAAGLGKVLASMTDGALGYLDAKVDDNTIAVINDELTFIADSINVNLVETDDIVVSGDTLRSTTQLNDIDTVLATKAYVLSVSGAGNGWDSLTFNSGSGYVSWWYAGSQIDSVSIDDRYIEIADSGVTYITPQGLLDTINNTPGLKTMIYEVTLPVAPTLPGSVLGATISPTPPVAWTFTASNGDLIIDHNTGRPSAGVTVFYNTTGSSYRQLVNFNNAYTGFLNNSDNECTIEGISTIYTTKQLKIYVTLR